jgi:proteic killer suppression protein
VIASLRSKALRRYWTRNEPGALAPEWRRKVTLLLATLEQAKRPEDMAIPGAGLHALTGDMAGRWALTVTRNWRITFGWRGEDAVDVDLEDYHGG